MKHKNFAHVGLSGLPTLGRITEQRIEANQLAIMQVLARAEKEKKYNFGDTLSFDEVDRIYNVGITEDEKRAWVWYRLNNNMPMRGGWKKYYPPSSGSTVYSDVLITTQQTEILDNAYRLISTVPKGIQLGKATKFRNTYGNKNMIIFVAPDGSKRWVDLAHVKTEKIQQSGSENYTTQLVKKGVLFYYDGVLMPYAIYAYGNMYDRELQLNKDKETIIVQFGNDIFESQKRIIEESKPKRISVQNPSPTDRPFISVISRLARENDRAKAGNVFFSIQNLREETGIDLQKIVSDRINSFRYGRSSKAKTAEQEKYKSSMSEDEKYTFSLVEAFIIWLGTLPKTDFKEVTPEQIITYYINGSPMSDKMEDEEKDTINKYAPIEGEELFSKFLYEALLFEDQQKLDFLWNRIYNAYSSIPYHKVPIGFECSALFKRSLLQFTPAQREGIAFIEIAGSGIIAYDVGVGKTMTAIIILANNMQSGKYKRPLLVVPNPTYKKWIREIVGYTDKQSGEQVAGVLTGLNIKVNDFYNLGVGVKYKNEQVDENSISIMTYEGFAKLGFSKEVSKELLVELENVLFQYDSDTKSKRDYEKDRQKYRELLGIGNKDTVMDIDVMGFDSIIIDEAHNFKNVFDRVATDENGDKRYDITSGRSDRAVKAFFHCNYIQRNFGANVTLLTATPFTNSPLEIYSMLSLVGYKSLKDMGIYNLQRFMQNFVLQSLEYANNYDGNIVLKPVVKSFKNRLVLQKIIHNHIAYKTGEEAGVKRPVKINLPRFKVMKEGRLVDLPKDEQVLTYLQPTDLQRANQRGINSAAQSAKKLGDIGRALNASLDNALSPFIYDGKPSMDYIEFVEGSPKILYTALCIKSVKEWHEQRGQSASGQVIYLNRGKDFFPHIKKYLETEVGYKTNVKFEGKKFDEVEVISSGITQEVKEGIKDAFLAGVVKVIIGTATIREGIDLQTRGSVIYNLYPDWNPTDIRQLEGRIWRQGNEFGYVRVVMPLVQDSMDVFVFQKLQEKTSRINDIWYRSDRGNVLDQESLDPEEIKFALFTDIKKLVELRKSQITKELSRKQVIAESNIDTMNRLAGIMQEYKHNREECLKIIREYSSMYSNWMNIPYEEWKNKALNSWNVKQYTNGGDEKKLKTYYERVKEYVDETANFLTNSDIDDKKIISLCNRGIDNHSLGLMDSNYQISQKRYIVANFRGAVSQLRKAEQTILKARGYDLNSDVKGIVEELKEELQTIKNQISGLSSNEWFENTFRDISEYKKKTAINGESPKTRAEQFAKLNYLLSYSSSEVATGAEIPKNRGLMLNQGQTSENTTNVDDKAKKLKIARAKTLTLKLKLTIAQAQKAA